MKISYRTHPVLEFLESDSPNIAIGEADLMDYKKCESELNLNFQSNWKVLRSKMMQNVDFLTKPYIEAIAKATPKLVESRMFEHLENETGVLSMAGLDICYDFHRGVINDKPGIWATIIVFVENKLKCFYLPQGIVFETNLIRHLTIDGYECGMKNILWAIQSHLIFKKFADTETRYLLPKTKAKDFHCRYINDTLIKVNIMDCKWITTLVQPDSFPVRGHFRLQPCGEGLKDRKLIWINDFVKEGYTAPARKLSNT